MWDIETEQFLIHAGLCMQCVVFVEEPMPMLRGCEARLVWSQAVVPSDPA